MTEPTQSELVITGATATSTLADAPPQMLGQITWRLINDADGTVSIAESTDGIVAIDDGLDAPNVRYLRPFTAPAISGRYLAIWRYFEIETAEVFVVETSTDTAFATVMDVQTRLGRDMTSAEMSQAELLLNDAATVISDAVGRDDGWAAQLAPVPNLFRTMSVALVLRSFDNPQQYASLRQQVGSYSVEVTRQQGPAMMLSGAEVAACRRALYGRTTDSAHVDSSFVAAQDEYWLRKQSLKMTDGHYLIP